MYQAPASNVAAVMVPKTIGHRRLLTRKSSAAAIDTMCRTRTVTRKVATALGSPQAKALAGAIAPTIKNMRAAIKFE